MTAMLSRQVRHLLDASTPPSADADLLDRFRRERDSAAIEILIRRHGPLVLAACRKVLAQHADIEDAFQASFLILLKSAPTIRRAESIGSWLYGVAHRVAVRARRNAARRKDVESATLVHSAVEPSDLTWREACDVVHQELDRLPERLRLPLLLCYLEGRSRDETAKQLGCTTQAVKGRLERGRNVLRRRLLRRGLALSAGLLPVLGENGSASGPPASLVQTTVAAMTGRPTSAVAALAANATATAFPYRLVAGAALAVCLVAGIGLASGGGKQGQSTEYAVPIAQPAFTTEYPVLGTLSPDAPRSPEAKTIKVRGRVVDPDGKPVAGAKLMALDSAKNEAVEKGVTGADGRFKVEIDATPAQKVVGVVAKGFAGDWAEIQEGGEVTLKLARELPIEGRVIDLEGKPLAGLELRMEKIDTMQEGDLALILKGWTMSPDGIDFVIDKTLAHPGLIGLPVMVKTDNEGRFRIADAARGRIVMLRPQGERAAHITIRVFGDERFDPKSYAPESWRSGRPTRPAPTAFGPKFEYVAAPTRTVAGEVRDKATGKPIAGVKISGKIADPYELKENAIATTSDAEGRFRLVGLRKAKRVELIIKPEVEPYLPTRIVVADKEGLLPLNVEIGLTKGIEVTGKLIDASTGQPVTGSLLYFPLRTNKLYQPADPEEVIGFVDGDFKTRPDGSFRVAVSPGPGIIVARAELPLGIQNQFIQARLAEKDKIHAAKRDPGVHIERIQGAGVAGINTVPLFGRNAYQVVDPAADSGPLTVLLNFQHGKSITGDVLDPDGKPLAGTDVCGLSAGIIRQLRRMVTPLSGSEFTATALDPGSPRTLAFHHKERKLYGTIELRGDEKERPSIKLKPMGSITGRLVDQDGKPLADLMVRVHYGYSSLGEDLLMSRRAFAYLPTTDKDGRFSVDNIAPDVDVAVAFLKGSVIYGQEGGAFPSVKAKPGEKLNLGEIKVMKLGSE